MKATRKKLAALLLGGLLSLSLLTACGSQPAEPSAPSEPQSSAPSSSSEVQSLGQFSTTDIYGKTVTQDIFSQYDLTMVNLFATWCSPCVQEIPELAQLRKNMESQGVNVIGVVMDAASPEGTSEETLAQAKVLAERTGADYPLLIPDQTAFNGRLIGVTTIPETFFVDREGNIVGETYLGARDLNAWTDIVTKELEGVQS